MWHFTKCIAAQNVHSKILHKKNPWCSHNTVILRLLVCNVWSISLCILTCRSKKKNPCNCRIWKLQQTAHNEILELQYNPKQSPKAIWAPGLLGTELWTWNSQHTFDPKWLGQTHGEHKENVTNSLASGRIAKAIGLKMYHFLFGEEETLSSTLL